MRVVTLRIQAEVEHKLDELPRASHEAQAMLRFGKLADRLRDALGLVRELDVWIVKLRRLRESQSETADYVPRSTMETVRQLTGLESRLTKKRQRAALKLVAEIEKRQENLMTASRDVEKAAGDSRQTVDDEQSATLLKEFAGITAEFPVLNEENLHDFRKRIKKIRYLAEIYRADPACGRIAAQMKKAQAAIGEWHDWQVLARTASRGKHAKNVEAGDLLSSLATEAFEAAIATCDGVMRRMADMGPGREIGRALKAPVRSEATADLPARKLA